MKIIALITILLLFGAANAQFDSILQPICGSLFSQSTSVLGSGGGSSPAFYIIEVALTIAVSVLLILGVLYAIGYGFGIDSLKAFVRTEYLESVFNLAMIVFISGGLAFAGSAVSFLSSVAGIGQTTTAPVTTISSAYGAICTNYVNYGAATVLDYAVEMSARLTVLDIFKNAFIIIEPNEFGFDGLFFSGLQPVDNIYSLQIDFYMAMAGMFIGIPVLLWMIYVLFPWFLYVGVLLRAFPWTRAAGGSFLAPQHDRIADHSSRTAVRSLRESILRTRCALLLQYADRSLTGRRLISAADRDQFIEEFGQPTWDALRKSEKLEVVA